MTSNKDGWDKAAVLGTLFAMLMVPLILALYGNIINASLRRSESQLRMVELAVGVLRESPADAPDSTDLRRWAVAIIDQYSEVPLTDNARETLIKTPLPVGPYWGFSREGDAVAWPPGSWLRMVGDDTAFRVVDDQTNEPIRGAPARLVVDQTLVLERISDEEGEFTMPISGLFPPTLTVGAPGYITSTIVIPLRAVGPVTIRLVRVAE